MTPSPIRKVLSTMQKHQVKVLLMGGQACVLYGAAEFSRDTDFVLHLAADNLERLRAALADLRADVVAVPEFDPKYLARGHAVHFRCQHPEAAGLRIDVMSVLRGVAPFDELWSRRTTVEVAPGESYDLLSLPDLVDAKKTQRDKDWPMVRRLVEASYFASRKSPNSSQVVFWLEQLRTTQLLIECARAHPEAAAAVRKNRPLLRIASAGDDAALDVALKDEEATERERDREYWQPLRRELSELRRRRQE